MFKKSTTRVGFSEDTAYTLITHPTTICKMSDYRIKEAAKHVCDSRDVSSSWLVSVIEFVMKKIHASETRSILCGSAASKHILIYEVDPPEKVTGSFNVIVSSDNLNDDNYGRFAFVFDSEMNLSFVRCDVLYV